MIVLSKDVLEDYLCALLSPEVDTVEQNAHAGEPANVQSPNQPEMSEKNSPTKFLQEGSASMISLAPTPYSKAETLREALIQPEFELASERKRQLQNLLAPSLTKPALTAHIQLCAVKVPDSKPKVDSVVIPAVQRAVVESPSKKVLPVLRPLLEPENSDQELEEELSELKAPAPWCDNGRPEWAQEPFHTLLFKVAGLSLAVPLVTLGKIHKLTDKLTPLFGQAEWFMGLQETPNGRVQAINTALYVMPERYDAAFLETAKFVISIDGLNWALAVDDVQQPQLLNPDDVTWRCERSKRPWLAGTVKSAMCALLDIPQMGYQLQLQQRQSEKRFA